MPDKLIFRDEIRVAGDGGLIRVEVRPFIPEAAMFSPTPQYSPFTGKRYGIPDMTCYACHHVLSVGANAQCTQHGILKRETRISGFGIDY